MATGAVIFRRRGLYGRKDTENREGERITSDLAALPLPPPAASLPHPLNGHETIQRQQTHDAEMAGMGETLVRSGPSKAQGGEDRRRDPNGHKSK